MTTKELEKALQLGHTIYYNSAIKQYRHTCYHIPDYNNCIFVDENDCILSVGVDILTSEQVEHIKKYYPEHLI